MKIWNTLSGQKEEFLPEHDPIRMYVCGVTPYSESHVGHAMSSIVFDTVHRYLEYRGFAVKHIQNFTDVDDKIISRAKELEVSPFDLAEKYAQRYLEDMDALNVRRAEFYPRVTQEIPTIIAVIQQLIDRGYAYPASGDVYYRVSQFKEYGKLSHRSLEDMIAGVRIEPGVQKEHPMDFALWKGAKPGEPQWPSPWGSGRPGWHIECSAMSMHYLGNQLDIHGGGQDLEFPHHENEVAQSEGATGIAPFAKYWMHNGMVRRGDEKMSKSQGNLVTIREALMEHSVDAIRMLVLSSHYRGPLTYTDDALTAAEKGVDRLRQTLRPGEMMADVGALDPIKHIEQFIKAMDDDFNSAAAISALFELAREINQARKSGMNIAVGQVTLQELAGVLGLRLEAATGALEAAAGPFIQLLIELRSELRRARNFPLADRIRQQLAEQNVTLEDTPQGTVWALRRPGT